MKDIVMALAVVLAINIFFFIAQTTMIEINPEQTQGFYNLNKSWLDKENDGSYILNSTNTEGLLSAPNEIDGGDQSFFTDIFSSVLAWLKDVTGYKYLDGIINAIPNFLQMLNLPRPIAFALGWFWHIFVFFLTIMFIKGES